MKRVLIRRGVEIEHTVRRPLRALTAEETSAVDAVVDSALE
jgi:dihydrodipicolinate synthase/N-acetylneuraminate lyase